MPDAQREHRTRPGTLRHPLAGTHPRHAGAHWTFADALPSERDLTLHFPFLHDRASR